MTQPLKFEFTPEFQADLIKYTLTHREGYKLLPLIQPEYFTLDEDAIIFYAIQSFHKKEHRVPSETMLLERIRRVFRDKDFRTSIPPDEQLEITEKAKKLATGYVQDADILLEQAVTFAKYVEVTHIIETQDITDVGNYESFVSRINQAMSIARDTKKEFGSFLIADIRGRQLARKEHSSIIPTPIRQLNKLTNAGGYAKHSILVILDKPKKFKTGMLLNLAIGYMKMKKRVFIADLENGEDEYMTRIEQSITNQSKADILSGEHDQKVQKILRKYRRLGAELVVQRFPAHRTTTIDIGSVMDKIKQEFGINFEVLIVDYAALMGSTTGKKDDTERISDVYLDLANLAKDQDLDHVWSANHVQRAAGKRESTRYQGEDIAKAIDIVRHVQGIFGLNRNPEEEAAGILRMEIVEQRDGKPFGRALFKANLSTQRAVEMTTKEQEDYYNDFGTPLEHEDDEDSGPVITQNGRKVKTDL